ncbi:hypothetical protein FEM03_07130 [Phragmitibacter flavus]|uniref:Type II secretion system protein M n=1 Tax=Phragmitibacter flavus TaxID=2576071 RepID=A0A5R8KG76_9BACT|nr:hypothetical protein [Phragmitibacter flavus]TLD71296.1 hypothetical protein FEM03_07130 [Phragmitibacter flavus]
MKSNERRLLMVAGMLFTLVVALVLSQRLMNWQEQIERRKHDLELMQFETESMLAEAPEWLEKHQWVTNSQPVANEGALEANAELDTIVKNAKQLGLTVQSQQLQETTNTEYYQQFGVTLAVKGDLEKVVTWMHGLLAPSQFRVVPSVRVVPDKESPSEVVVMIEFWRWYAAALAGKS